MRTLFGTVVYEGVREYINEFTNSLEEQYYKNFNFYVLNDGLHDKASLKELSKVGNKCFIENTEGTYNPAQLRMKIINYAIENSYDLLIFGDSDDVFSNNRIEELVNNCDSNYEFYYNKLIIKNTDVDFFKGKLPKIVEEQTALDNYNFIGMSNSAININSTKELLKNLRNVDDLSSCIAFDWYLYTFLLKQGCKGKLVDKAITFYRIYGNNIAGNTNELNNKKLEAGLRVKKFQYETLSNYDHLYKYKVEKINDLCRKLQDYNFREFYIKIVNDNFKYSVFWWENIKLLNELEGFR